jgi:hypothetical protein
MLYLLGVLHIVTAMPTPAWNEVLAPHQDVHDNIGKIPSQREHLGADAADDDTKNKMKRKTSPPRALGGHGPIRSLLQPFLDKEAATAKAHALGLDDSHHPSNTLRATAAKAHVSALSPEQVDTLITRSSPTITIKSRIVHSASASDNGQEDAEEDPLVPANSDTLSGEASMIHTAARLLRRTSPANATSQLDLAQRAELESSLAAYVPGHLFHTFHSIYSSAATDAKRARRLEKALDAIPLETYGLREDDEKRVAKQLNLGRNFFGKTTWKWMKKVREDPADPSNMIPAGLKTQLTDIASNVYTVTNRIITDLIDPIDNFMQLEEAVSTCLNALETNEDYKAEFDAQTAHGFTTKERFCEAQAEAKCHDLIDEPEQRINEWIEEQKMVIAPEVDCQLAGGLNISLNTAEEATLFKNSRVEVKHDTRVGARAWFKNFQFNCGMMIEQSKVLQCAMDDTTSIANWVLRIYEGLRPIIQRIRDAADTACDLFDGCDIPAADLGEDIDRPWESTFEDPTPSGNDQSVSSKGRLVVGGGGVRVGTLAKAGALRHVDDVKSDEPPTVDYAAINKFVAAVVDAHEDDAKALMPTFSRELEGRMRDRMHKVRISLHMPSPVHQHMCCHHKRPCTGAHHGGRKL